MPPAPASPQHARRKRASRREKSPATAAAARRSITLPATGALLRQLSLAAWGIATVVLLALTAGAVEKKITWYLAVDQFGYLTFAHDLLHGRIFHHWAPLDAIGPGLPPRVDVLMQTYVYDNGLLHCRYAPGFALILAGWLALFGDDGAHYLNPTVFIALLVLALAFQARVFRSRWRATAGVALIILLSGSTWLFYWALTLVRDLSAHLAGLLGLFLLLPRRGGGRLTPRRALAAGLILGFGVSIRPDAVLYCASAVLLAAYRWYRERAPRRRIAVGLAAGALGLFVGLTPFLSYNWVATGNPLRPTQGMEIQDFLPPASSPSAEATAGQRVGYPSAPWRGGSVEAVQGGGLKLRNLPIVLPQNLDQFRKIEYGDLLLALAVLGALVSLVRHRALFLAVVPYTVLAFLLFSCWSRPDARYFAGVHVMLPMLIVEGAVGSLDVIRRLWRARAGAVARALAVSFALLLLVAAATVDVPANRGVLGTVAVMVALIAALGALAAATWPGRRVAAIAAPVLALALVVFASQRALAALESRATFQRGEMLRARATFASAVEPGAVVITTEDVGRPAENIQYYSGVAHALYLTDLSRWRMPIAQAAELLSRAGMKPYLFIPTVQAGRAGMLGSLAKDFTVELAADVAPRDAINYFVAASFHRGVHMELWRIKWRGERPPATP